MICSVIDIGQKNKEITGHNVELQQLKLHTDLVIAIEMRQLAFRNYR